MVPTEPGTVAAPRRGVAALGGAMLGYLAGIALWLPGL